MRVLLISDDQVWTQALTEILARQGHRTDSIGLSAAAAYCLRQRWQAMIIDGASGDVGQDILRLHGGWSGERKEPVLVSVQANATLRQAWLEAGVDAFIPYPVDAPSLLLTLNRCREMTTLYQQSEDSAQRLRVLRAQLQENLYSASLVQRDLLPDANFRFPGLSVAWFIQSCEDLGGDLVSLLPLDDRRLAFAVIDVAGHGAKAAILGVQISRRFRSSVAQWDSGINPEVLAAPRRLAKLFNHEFPMDYRSLQFFTMCYGVIDTASGVCTYVGCGHPHPLLVSADGSVRELPSQGHPIGILPNDQAHFQEQTIVLEYGESLVLYSDGLSEAINGHGDILDVRGISQALKDSPHNAQAQISHLSDVAQRWREGNPVSDDCTALVIAREYVPS